MTWKRDLSLLLGAVLVAGALYNHYFGHSVLLVEIISIAIGATIFIYGMWQKDGKESPITKGILISLLSKFLNEKQIETILPLSGFILLVGWTLLKIFVTGDTGLTMGDVIITLLAISVILYYFGPSKYQIEKDFIVLYLIFLTIVFAIIVPVTMSISGESYASFSAYSEFYLVTQPVAFISNIFGANVNAVLDLQSGGMSNNLEFSYHGRLIVLGIGITCSGLYTFGLFFSAFLSFIIVKYRKIDRYIGTALLIGAFVTWASNIVRMVIVVLVGAAYGFQALAIVHMYIGIVLFVLFASVFWVLIVRWLDKKEGLVPPPTEKQEETKA